MKGGQEARNGRGRRAGGRTIDKEEKKEKEKERLRMNRGEEVMSREEEEMKAAFSHQTSRQKTLLQLL